MSRVMDLICAVRGVIKVNVLHVCTLIRLPQEQNTITNCQSLKKKIHPGHDRTRECNGMRIDAESASTST